MKTYEFSSENHIGVRLDKALADLLDNVSRSGVQRLINDEQVTVNGELKKNRYVLQAKEKIIITIPEPKDTSIVPVKMDLDIVYEDSDILIINKPKGMVVHPAPGHFDDTLVNGILHHCKGDLSGINGEIRPGIVHRIDKDTTGLLVVCKNDFAHDFIAKQLEAHTVTRSYEAIVYNNFKEEEGTVDAPIARHRINRKKMAIDQRIGKEAITHYRVIERLKDNRFTHIACQLETGRTHQIRVHMASIMHPLLGDEVYGPSNKKFNLQGQCLHAKTLGFIHPSTKSYISFESPLPDYFSELLNKLR